MFRLMVNERVKNNGMDEKLIHYLFYKNKNK